MVLNTLLCFTFVIAGASPIRQFSIQPSHASQSGLPAGAPRATLTGGKTPSLCPCWLDSANWLAEPVFGATRQ